MQDLQKRLTILESELTTAWDKLYLNQKLQALKTLEQEIAKPELWHNPEDAKAKNLEFARLSEELGPWQLLKTQTDDLHELLAFNSTDLGPEITDQLTAMENTYQTGQGERRVLLGRTRADAAHPAQLPGHAG